MFLSPGDGNSLEKAETADKNEEINEFKRLWHEQKKVNAVLIGKMERIEAAIASQSSET